jgi:predicted nucleotidyltransferase
MIGNPESGFQDPLLALESLLKEYKNQGVLIGGIAASLLGKARFTADIDVLMLLSVEEIPELMNKCKNFGLSPRIENAEEFAQKNRMVLLRHDSSGIDVDLTMGILPFEVEIIERSQKITVGNVTIPLPTPEDLIILKAVANRPKDLEDIKGIILANPNLDQDRVKFWLKQFSEILENPDLWDQIQKLFPE